MVQSRGRPVRPMPVHPERVISRAVKAGLSATIILQRDISNKVTKKYYERSSNRWRIRQHVYQITKDRGAPDFSHINKAEASIRDDTRRMLFEKAAKYGFTEVSRQKNADDTVDSLNQRFNVCGVVVRENSEIMFPMPNPVGFGSYTRRDGKGRKKYRRAGYRKSSFGPRVVLAHPDLPSLDFGDTIRSHNEYLATFCAIHNVPVRETAKYSHLFYLLTRPYLEYLYSESKCGKANFQKGVNWALRQVKELILEAGYRLTIRKKETVTEELEFEESKNRAENKTFFKHQECEAREFYGDHAAVNELGRLRGRLGDDDDGSHVENETDGGYAKDNDSIFTKSDVEYIRKKVAKRARIAGSIVHRRVSDLFPSPWHLNVIILSGNMYTRSSDYLILSEVPLETEFGSGKIDLLLLERTISNDGKRVFLKPTFALEIKTRLGQSWYIEADYKESEVRPDGSSLQRIVSDYPLSDYPLSDGLWDSIVQSTPAPTARKQLDIYCQAIAQSYRDATHEKLDHILRGVVVIDSSSDIAEIRRVLEGLIVHTYESVKDRVTRLERTVFTLPENDCGRIALVLDEQSGPGKKGNDLAHFSWSPTYSPFKLKKRTGRKFLLYLSGQSSTSAGHSAAWNARYYHGLQFLYQMKKTQDNTRFVWIDLASQFGELQLAEARLHLRPRNRSEEEVATAQPDEVREFFESIKMTGYLDEVLLFLYGNGKMPSFELKMMRNERKVVVVTGTDTLLEATPASHREKLSAVIDHLINSLPDDDRATIMWFDNPVPSFEKSIPYSSRALIPYFENSPLGEVVTEMIWNLPVAPRSAVQNEKWGLPVIGEAPLHDDIRAIIRHSLTDLQIELVHVPLLRGWSKRFRNRGTGRVIQEREVDDIIPDKAVRDRMRPLSLTLLPWLVKLWSDKTVTENSMQTLGVQISNIEDEFRGEMDYLDLQKTVLIGQPSSPPSLLDLVRFRLPENIDALSYQAMTAGRINSQRLYRSPRKLQTQPLRMVHESLSIQQVPITERKPEQEWLYGVRFESNDGDIPCWWMVIQDPTRPSRLLVGCFVDRPPDKDGFLWSESRQEILTQSSVEQILGSPQAVMIGAKTEDELEFWISHDDDEPVYAGVFEFRGQGRTAIGHLRAVWQIFTDKPKIQPSFAAVPSELFHRRVADSLRKYLTMVTSPTPVRAHLEMVDGVCHITLENTDDETVQEMDIEYTADLVSLLRWPIARGGPLFTDSGEYVTWSIFDDIDYGELDFIAPYVTFTAARATPAELPKRVSQFFDDAESLAVSISHDATACPLVSGAGLDHDACWRIDLPSYCPIQIKKQLGRPLTGEEVNGLLSPGRLYAGKLYAFDFTPPTVSEIDESIVFHEERYIRMFLRRHGQRLKRLSPGTFLHAMDQRWMVTITWDGNHFKWQAQSTASGFYFKGDHQTIELLHGHDAEEECRRLLHIITSQIPQAHIVEYPELEELVLAGLRNHGYSKRSPACELRIIEQSASIFRYGVFLRDGDQRFPLLAFTIDATEKTAPDAILDDITMALEEGELSVYYIGNTSSFLKRLSSWVNEHIPVTEEDSDTLVEYEVTLSVDDKGEAILWRVEADGTEESRTGVLYDDLKILLHASIREATREVRETFELDTVSELGIVANLDDVVKRQVPDMIRQIRYRRK